MKKVFLMGILNVTPDSFSDGGIYYQNIDKAVAQAKEMVREGADIIDVGGDSTRPGSTGVSAQEELVRVIPVIDAIRKEIGNSVTISVDTNKAVVAQNALERGVTMVNSLGGLLFDPKMADVVKKFNCKFIIYHIKGKSRTMQKGEIKYKNVVGDIGEFFQGQMSQGVKKGIQKSQFILDPGIGFGKTVQQNITIIKELRQFQKLNCPVMVGLSRKSHLGMILKVKLNLPEIVPPLERLETTLAETAIALINGATYIRTHDVLQTKKFISVFEELI